MGRVLGFGLMAAGIGAAAYVLPIADFAGSWSGSGSDKKTVATATVPSLQAAAAPSDPLRSSPVTAQAQQALLTATVPAPAPAPQRGPDFSAPQFPGAQPKTVQAQAPQPQAPAAQPTPAFPPFPTQPAARAAEEPKAARLAPIAPPIVRPAEPQRVQRARGDGDGRVGLARDIQSELKRVGCFDGDATGEWTPATQRAMKTFIDRVNAKLPVSEPDYILLTLLQGQQTRVCGANCPTGQSLGNDGRCVPSAILAQSQKRPVQQAARPAPADAPSAPSSWDANTRVVTATPPASPRVVQPQAVPAPKDQPVVAQPPALSSSPPMVAAAPQSPLPGRMSVGGPVLEPSVAVPTPVPADRADAARPAPLPRLAAVQPGADQPPAALPPPAVAAVTPPTAPINPQAAPQVRRPALPNAQQVRRPAAAGPVPPRGLAGYAPAPPPRVQPSAQGRQVWARNIFRNNELNGR
ncbi:MAG: hypothetical protein RL291_126 [Pseudomonadota bacterium]